MLNVSAVIIAQQLQWIIHRRFAPMNGRELSQRRVLGAVRRRTLVGASPLRGDFAVPYSRPSRPLRRGNLTVAPLGGRSAPCGMTLNSRPLGARQNGMNEAVGVFTWVGKNYEWFFSGLGVFLLGGSIGLFRYLGSREQVANCDQLAIHTQHLAFKARDLHENYDHALGVFIVNTGDSPIHIQRALFRDRIPFLWVFHKNGQLPIYPNAFKDIEADAFEMKFGDQWYDPQTDILGRKRTMTYIPLSDRVADDSVNKRKHGQVILHYTTQGKSGIHRVYV